MKRLLFILALLVACSAQVADATRPYTRRPPHTNLKPPGIGKMRIGSTFVVR